MKVLLLILSIGIAALAEECICPTHDNDSHYQNGVEIPDYIPIPNYYYKQFYDDSPIDPGDDPNLLPEGEESDFG